IDPRLEDDLLDGAGLPIQRWLDGGAASIVKHGPHRTVYRVNLSCGTFFVKHYRVADWQAFLQNVVRPAKAQLEWDAVERVRAAGIPTVRRVALGVRKRGLFAADSYLVTREIDNVRTLHEFVARHSASAPASLRHGLSRALGELIGTLHRRGLLHRDLHAGNVLVRVDPKRGIRLWLIDLHAVSSKRRLSPRQVADNLATFGVFFTLRATPADRQRFFDAYRNCVRREPTSVTDWLRSSDPAALHGFEQLLERSCTRQWRRAVDKADRKWLRGHRKLIVARNETTHCRGIAELGEEFVRAVCENPSTIHDAHEVQAACVRVGDGTPLTRHWLGRARSWTASRAVWEIGHALLRRGIPVAKPLMFVEGHSVNSHGGERGGEMLLTEDDSIPGDAALTAPASVRRSAEVLRRLHDQRFLHGELSRASFRRVAGEVLLEGVESVIPVRRVRRKDRIAQLAALSAAVTGVSPADRLRFLLAYLGPQRNERWKAVWRTIAAESPSRDAGIETSRRRFLKAALVTGALFLGCRTPKRQVLALPSRHSIRSGQLLVLSDFKLRKDQPLIQDLVLLRKQVTVALQLPAQREEVVVYIFESRRKYREYLNKAYPGLPGRRAYFVGTPDQLAVYTYWGERIQEDLRHEYTHGLLHATLRDVPLWIDEGFAEYFEVAGSQPGTVNTEYAGRLAAALANGWRPSLPKLERLEEFSQMQRVHYQEAWAWVHYLLQSGDDGSREVLLGYLRDLRTQQHPKRLSKRLRDHLPRYEERLIAHVAKIQTPQLLPGPRIRPVAGKADVPAFPE
ncbi:MAG: lipopolysaccharide kinase InaA family protein, partial [Planctomycetaceae bacterium]